ncbi:MAG: GIY-YIG nuclease family protein [Chloroflexi bacterium]|nr:GIY-YIG nuclease family protein [Chloroflexota bacterium]
MPYVYLLKSVTTDRFYIGCTNDMDRRLGEHNSGKSASTKPYRPWELVHSEYFENLAQARQRERYLKAQKSRKILMSVMMGD